MSCEPYFSRGTYKRHVTFLADYMKRLINAHLILQRTMTKRSCIQSSLYFTLTFQNKQKHFFSVAERCVQLLYMRCVILPSVYHVLNIIPSHGYIINCNDIMHHINKCDATMRYFSWYNFKCTLKPFIALIKILLAIVNVSRKTTS